MVASRVRGGLRVACVLSLAACTRPRTEIVVTVHSELSWGAGGDLQALRIRAGNSPADIRLDRAGLLGTDPTQWTVPLTFGLLPLDGGEDAPVWIEVAACAARDAAACSAASAVVVQRAIVNFRHGSTDSLDLWLGARCRNVTCAPTDRCARDSGQCEPATRAGTDLHPWSGNDAGPDDVAFADVPPADVPATDAGGMDAPRADVSVSPDVPATPDLPVISDVRDAAATDAADAADASDASTTPDGGTTSQPSCATPGTSGCGMALVPAAGFTLGSPTDCTWEAGVDGTCGYSATPQQTGVRVGNFAIDAYEVSVGRFRVFWAARMADGGASIRARGPIRYPDGTSIAWSSTGREPSATAGCRWAATAGAFEAHPVNCVDWWTAQEFCAWDGGRLPTETEWEYVARDRPVAGTTVPRLYPWGEAEPSTTCDRAQWNGCPGDDGATTRRVGSFAPTGGLYDLAGNVWEWTADTYAPYSSGAAGACANRAGMMDPLCNSSPTALRVMRGGSSTNLGVPALLRGATRSDFDPGSNLNLNVGFRCARTVP